MVCEVGEMMLPEPSVLATKLETPPSTPAITVVATEPARLLTIGARMRSEKSDRLKVRSTEEKLTST